MNAADSSGVPLIPGGTPAIGLGSHQKGHVVNNKLEEATVQVAIQEAKDQGWEVFKRGKHIVAICDGVPLYLGGGVEAPRWDPMGELK